MRRKNPLRPLLAMAAGLAVTASVAAQTSRPEREREDDRAASDAPRGVLAGPEVKPSEKGSGASFVERGRERSRARAGAARRWLRRVGELDLTAAQRSAVRTEVAGLARQRRAFQREHGPELRALEKEVRAARRDGGAAPREPVARLQELRALAPRADAAQERIWGLLTDEQRNELRTALAQQRASRERPRDAEGGPAADERLEKQLDEAGRRRLRFLRERRGDDAAR